jgi:hypothetical protein
VPPNGLVLYTGTIVTDDGKEKKVPMDWILEPWLCISLMLFYMLANIMAESSCYDRNSGCQQWVVMAAHPCYSWWWWRSDTLWASLIRLWPHSILSCLCCEVFLQIFLQS